MSYGKMRAFLEIIKVEVATDEQGFAVEKDICLAKVRGYREQKNGSTAWLNRASFSDATDLFKVRKIPDLELKPGMFIVCDGHRFVIRSADDVKGKGLYIEVLGREVSASGKSNVDNA
jgi:head-tail adaptor